MLDGQTDAAPEIEQVGGGLTVKTTSSVRTQPAVSVTVNRKVAVAGALAT